MEILELILSAPEFLGCCLEMFVGSFDLGTAFMGYKLHKEKKKRRAAIARNEPVLPARPVWPFVLVVFTAVFLTGLALVSVISR